MKKQILNVAGSQVLSKKAQQEITGGAGGGIPDLSKCGCDCAGSVTGPKYCKLYFACLQVYTC